MDFEPRLAGALRKQGIGKRTGAFQGPKHPADRPPQRNL